MGTPVHILVERHGTARGDTVGTAGPGAGRIVESGIYRHSERSRVLRFRRIE